MVRVPSDPTRINVDNPSFRVQLGPSSLRLLAAAGHRVPVPGGLPAGQPAAGLVGAAAAGAGAAGAARRRAPVVWTGRADDTAAGRLLQAIPKGDAARKTPAGGADFTATQVLPRVDDATRVLPRVGDDATRAMPLLDDTGAPSVAGRRRTGGGGAGADATQVLPRIPEPAGPYEPGAPGGGPRDGAYEGPYDPYAPHDPRDPYAGPDGGPDADGARGRVQRHGADPVRHAYYPGRRMNLGVVLLPLRIILGFVSLYAGMGKLSDPLFFDGGEHGSMRSWLDRLEPWSAAEPLYRFALAHPVGTGLTIAFLQVIVGVLTVCGLWQRLAAALGGLLAVGLLVTVAWQTSPAYDATDVLFLAAWSPLVIAGAPVYSLDARLAGEAWRTLGPRSELWELRRRVLRRGTVLATVIVGLALLVGSMLGAAVRSSSTVRVPGPDEPPVNHLPGSPLPSPPAGEGRGGAAGSATPSRADDGAPGGAAPSPGAGGEPGASDAGPATESGSVPTEEQPAAPPASQAPPPPSAEDPAPPPSGTGSGTSPGASDSGTGGTGGTDGGGSSGGGSTGGGGDEKKPGLIGGLLG